MSSTHGNAGAVLAVGADGSEGGAAGAGDAPAPASVEPPRGGPGATRDAWRAYAASLGVAYGRDASREEIINAVDAHLAEEVADADNVPVPETETDAAEDPVPQETAVETVAAPETVTYVVAGQRAPDFAQAPNRPKVNLLVRLGGKSAQFVNGRYTTSSPAEIAALDDLAAKHSDGVVREVERETPDGVEVFRRWDAYAEVRKDPTLNTYGIRREPV